MELEPYGRRREPTGQSESLRFANLLVTLKGGYIPGEFGREGIVMSQPFRISTGLKDLIGRDLITNDFVAVFELVKNAFDAHATWVEILFEGDKIVISDNGKGMSNRDIQNKWLFVAYSAKRDGTEDRGYREGIIKRTGAYAGAKGVGRFSCDRLGERLLLASRAKGRKVQILNIDWRRYEKDAKQEFGSVGVDLTETTSFPGPTGKVVRGTGTVLEITGLRSDWGRHKLLALKRELAKLINPFGRGSDDFEIEITAPTEMAQDEVEKAAVESLGGGTWFPVNGKIENNILDVLKMRTTSIRISITTGETIQTVLEDRGEQIYTITEANPYRRLDHADLNAEIYFLNRSAKMVFARRMGLPSVQFGSIFLFRNGFRVFPIGDENDDFFGLARRKQQGMRRFLGNRDLIGRVEIKGVKGFDEATSRDHGLIRTKEVTELVDCIRDKCVRRLERYVVDITWKDAFDKDMEDTSRMRLDESSVRITKLVSRLADTEGVELVDYNPDLVRMVDERSEAFESSLDALELLAEKTEDDGLLGRVAEAKARIKELQAAEAAAREAERRAEDRAATAVRSAAKAEGKYQEERERNRFLVAATSLDHDTIVNLHHQILMYASDVHVGIRRMMGKLREGAPVVKREWIDFLESVSFRNSQILTASRFATKGGYKQHSTEENADLALYISDYITTVSSLWAPRGVVVDVQHSERKFERPFRPIEIGIVIDNLVSNASKARATRVSFFLQVAKGPKPELVVTVADDGTGWPTSVDPLEEAFDKGVTTTDGSGLGLYHVKQVIEGLGGVVEAVSERYSRDLDGAQLVLRVPS